MRLILTPPIIIDSMTRFDRVNALSGDLFQYNYTLLTLDKTQIDTTFLKNSGKESIIKGMKQNPKASIFRDNNIEIQAKYVDKNGADVVTVTIYSNEY